MEWHDRARTDNEAGRLDGACARYVHCVWLDFRFLLSFHEVEELMLERGVGVSYETIRRWCAKFGQTYANQLRRRRARPGDTWHLDEVFIKINGTQHHLWCRYLDHGEYE
ncbi:transposase-like protein [Rhodococcus sp. 27YEA15]